ncbi:hypothetical protein APASM_3709 [Actinosynnema pretiosum subsp. pretiosum]|nr:hypothetical protein APASM_3709 [Actinosynnema pretiosum subsp. pretiosum]
MVRRIRVLLPLTTAHGFRAPFVGFSAPFSLARSGFRDA